MCIKSLLNNARVGSWVAQFVVAIGGALVVAMPAPAFAQSTTVCGPTVKEEVAKAVAAVENASDAEKARAYAEIYSKYQPCAAGDAPLVPASFHAAARECGATVSNLGSLYFEEMSCCGYDPQRRQFACPLKIKQVNGYGGAPLPGSREHVLNCVADAAGILQPVGRDSVHLANALPGNVPTWQFAVIAAANENLQTVQPMSNQTRRARSILSWALPPTNCNYVPIWGNALNYRIRLDQ
jgi:hypothetical protein